MHSELFLIYKIINQVNGKVYIGQTNNPENRWSAHKSAAKKPEYPIQYAISKYGKENFLFQVVATCKNIEDADYTEIELIKQCDSRNPDKGYNLSLGGKSWNEQQRQHHSALMKEKYAAGQLVPWNKGLFGEDNPLTDFPRSAETIAKIIQTKQSNPFVPNQDQINKMRQGLQSYLAVSGKRSASQGSVRTLEQIKQMSEIRKGKHFSPDTQFKKGGRGNPISHVAWNKGISTPIKLTAEQIQSIKNDTRSASVIAKEYGVHKTTILYHKNKGS